MQPIYTAENTNPAYQLNWSVSLFGKVDFPPALEWLDQLKAATEPDGVRTLEARVLQSNVAQMFVSTLPAIPPSEVIRSLKGRWQYLMKDQHPKAFRRNYHIHSIGEANCEVLDKYVAGQTQKHPMADPAVQRRLEGLQFHDPDVDLSEVQTGHYGQFVYNLQLVFETAEGWHEIREALLSETIEMVISAAAKKGWRLSRIGLLSNHIHILLSAGMTESPTAVALSLMNNLAFVQGMKSVFRFSYYVGTFGRYDRGAVRRDSG